MTKLKTYHIFCIDCDRGWHLMNVDDFKIIDRVHFKHRKMANPRPIKCGDECANDWAMVRKAWSNQ